MGLLSPSDRALGDLLVGRNILTLAQLDEAVGLAGNSARELSATPSCRELV